MFFDFIFGNSYIDVKFRGRLYLDESFEKLKSMMNDNNATITVHVTDPITGVLSDKKTIKKSDITNYGSN
jgi:hypothetical protein